MNTFQRTAVLVNRLVTPLLQLPVIGPALRGSMVELRYTGRRSGKPVSLVVGYQRKGDDLLIGVAMPDSKTWWRNFHPDGGPITVVLDGAERTGRAVARRDDRGVSVKVTLDPA